MTRDFLLSVRLSRIDMENYYHGNLRAILIRADSGEMVQIEVRHFRPYMSQLGVKGRFRLKTEISGKFISLEKIN